LFIPYLNSLSSHTSVPQGFIAELLWNFLPILRSHHFHTFGIVELAGPLFLSQGIQMNRRAVIYIRTSSETQSEKSSPVEQEADCRRLAEERGLNGLAPAFKGFWNPPESTPTGTRNSLAMARPIRSQWKRLLMFPPMSYSKLNEKRTRPIPLSQSVMTICFPGI
jgi:hypothetical protein